MSAATVTVSTRAGGGGRVWPIVRAVLPLIVVIGLWWLAAVVFTDLRVIPTPWAVLQSVISDVPVYLTNGFATVSVAARGFLIGNLAAIILGVIFVQVAWVESLLLRIAVASFCIPLVAIAPILVVILPGDGPQQALAALSVFFTTLISVVLGLRSADPASLMVVKSLGGKPRHALLKIRYFAMLPSLFAGLKIAAPAALLGAIIGEYLGASEGLGVMLVQSQSSFQVARTWGVALVMSLIAGAAYAIWGLIGRLLTPWASQDVTLATGMVPTRQKAGWRGIVGTVLGSVGSLVIVIAAWYGLIGAFRLNPYFAKTPLDVFTYLFTVPAAPENRARIGEGLLITLGDAALGYVFGTAAAVMIALLVVSFRSFERTVMPLAIVLRSIPLVALTPLLALVFGRGLVGVTVIVSIVTFFPTLVNVVLGLRSAPTLAVDVIHSLGGSDTLATRKVRMLYALPAFFAAARIAVPGALGGATLAEWLATGKGIGAMLVQDYAASRFSALWAESVTIVVVSVIVYGLIGLIERPVLRRYAS